MIIDLIAGTFGAVGKIKYRFKKWIMPLCAFLFIAAVSSLATASGPIFAIEKNFCSGVPSPLSSVTSPGPENCTLATQVAQGDPVYYVISITSPWGQPQQVVDLTDHYPAGFVPTAGALFCKDNLGNTVPWSPSNLPNGIAQVTLNMTQTIYCFVPGTYQNDPATSGNDTGNKKNTAEGKNTDGNSASADVKTEVLQTNPLGSDLAITKSSSGPINVTAGSANITYTITIKNNGPADVDIGDSFMLHDNLSLPPSSVPFNVAYVGSACTATVGTDCLTGSPTLLNGNPVFVGTMAPKPFFDWGFAAGQGHIEAGGTITLTITVNISQLSGIDCVVALNSDGLRNTALLTLIDKNTGDAFADANPANNTASVTTPITTGQTLEDPDCGKAHLRIRKKQINPIPVTNPVAWGTPVTYEIYIQNVSLPNQSITINQKDLEDWVTEGINTPPFYRSHVVTKCVASSPGTICAPFTPSINAAAPFYYTYYGNTNKAWDTGAPIKLPANGHWVKFNTTLIYAKPDCETVPNANPKPILNTAKVRYKASAYGSSSSSPQNVTFNQEWTTQTNMKNQPPCNFKVTKKLISSSGTVQFNNALHYFVTFTNGGNARNVGTVMDAARITIPNYATSLPFSSTWSCTQIGGVTGATMSGTIAASSVTNTATPAMGSPTVNLGNNIYFNSGATLQCHIYITVKRPPLNDPYCTTDDARFENMALMDVTNPFNTNIFWPPSSTYNVNAPSNPPVQNVNWASTGTLLPKCWDAHVEKSATVGGLPANTPAWTYAGNTNAVNFAITTTNDADSPFGTSTAPGNGWTITDTLASPYSNAGNQQGMPVCSPLGWCWTAPLPNDGKKQIGVKNLGVNASGVWNIKTTGPWTNGVNIQNCAKLQAVGYASGPNGPNWYNNANDPTKLESCVTVPVIETTKIEVRKQVIDQTGAGVTAMGAFGFGVACTPYAIPSAATTSFSLSTGSSGYSNYQAVNPVAKYGTCTVSETSMPAIPAAMATKCNGAANVIVTSSAPVVLTNLAAVTNQVTVTNTYSCKPLQSAWGSWRSSSP